MIIKDKLYCNDGIDIVFDEDTSKHKVIASDEILKDNLIEECPVMVDTSGCDDVESISFPWPKNAENPICNVILHGLGGLISRTNNESEANVDWECDFNHNLIIIKSIKDINLNDELLIFDPYHKSLYHSIDYKKFMNKLDNIDKDVDELLITLEDGKRDRG